MAFKRIKGSIKITGLLCAFLCLVPCALSGESIFLKDGSIIEGSIVKRSDKKVTLEKANKIRSEIPRSLILRIISGSDYKRPVYISWVNGKVIKGHIVDENSDSYTIRKKLSSSDEIVISKKEVKEILKERLSYKGKRVYHSPGKAAMLSLIPIRSGSFLIGTDGYGAAFCIVKSMSLVVPLAIFFSGAFGGSDPNSSQNDNADVQNNFFSNDRARILVLSSIALWAAATASDAIYSYYRVKGYNEKHFAPIDRSRNVSFLLMPRSSMRADGVCNNYCAYDGLNLFASYRF